MRKFYILILSITSFTLSSCSTLKTTVLFGERASSEDVVAFSSGLSKWYPNKKFKINPKDTLYHTVRIFIDREGIIYPPNCRILNELMIGNNYSLLPTDYAGSDVFRREIIKYLGPQLNVSEKENYSSILKEKYEEADLTSTKLKKFREEFNEISVSSLLNQITSLKSTFDYNDITFLFVGINNTFINTKTSNNSSESKLAAQRQKIQKVFDDYNYRMVAINPDDSLRKIRKTLYVEVHWDGRFTSQKGIKTALNYNAGLVSSYKAGLALRPLLNKIDDPKLTITMMSHSSGANVICESLFNQKSKIRAYSGVTKDLWKLLDEVYNDKQSYYCTPTESKINAFLLEASLPGIETFQDYHDRNPDGALPNSDNYRITIGYNVNDPDLGKRFGKKWVGKLVTKANYNNKLTNGLAGPFGSTSLGVLEAELVKTRELFRKYYNIENFDSVDFSYSIANGTPSPNTFHDMVFYLSLPLYEETIRKMYGLL